MKIATATSSLGEFLVRSSVTGASHPSSSSRSPHTPSLPDARPHSDRFRCSGRESNFLAVWPQFARENAQRAELKSQTNDEAAVMAERPKVEWATRAAFLRKNLDTLYAQFREAMRQFASK